VVARKDPGWRDRAAAELLVKHLEELAVSEPALVMEEASATVAEALDREGVSVTKWNRRALGGTTASPWPPAGPFSLATLRIPRSKEELVMALHASGAVLAPGGTLLVYGAKDEGIRSALSFLEDLFSGAETLGVGGHARVLRAIRSPEVGPVKGSLVQWREVVDPGYPKLRGEWVTYPGVFGYRGLDPGTRILLGALPDLPPGARILDFGCGSGIVGAVAGARGDGLKLDLLDVDAVALEAARENLPEASLLLADGLASSGDEPYDAILSNPPFHRGKAEDPELVRDLVLGAPEILSPQGILVFVTQKRLRVDRQLEEAFQDVDILAEDATYRVWRGRKPRRTAV
jgi:16S rRNA (guanine1207-N2)-methyltransferase